MREPATPWRANDRKRSGRSGLSITLLAIGISAALAVGASRAIADDGPSPVPPVPTPDYSADPSGVVQTSATQPAIPVVIPAPAKGTKPIPAEAPAGAASTSVSDQDGDATDAPNLVAPPPAALQSPVELKPLPTSAPLPPSPPANLPVPSGPAPSLLSPLHLDPVTFKGIQPGVTMVEELTERWGKAPSTDRDDGSLHRVYDIPPFHRIDVTLAKGRVAAILIQLDKPFDPEVMAKQLKLDDVRPVPVDDDGGKPLGQAFPERGVLFSFVGGAKLVDKILLEPIDAEPFLIRAELTAESSATASLADLDYAIHLDPNHPRAFRLRAQILDSVGHFDDALQAAEQAFKLAPDDPNVRLTKAHVLGQLDRYAEAIELTKGVAAQPGLPAEVKARAWCQLGDLVADGPEHDYHQAIEFHLTAIKRAETLSAEHRVAVRRAGMRVQINATLGTANDIAWGYWQQKDLTVPKWLDRADALADALTQDEGADLPLRLHVARRALAAAPGAGVKWNPLEWTKRAVRSGKQLLAATEDPLSSERFEWELGTALFDALECDHARGDHAHAITNSEMVLKYLEKGSVHRQQTPADVYLMGRFYYRTGEMHALLEHDHKGAAAWFDRALPLLDRPLPPTATNEIGRQGEAFVGIGISYWQIGRRDEAVRLTQQGVDAMAQAVKSNLLEERSLAIPYGNLSTMQRELGHQDQARAMAEQAAKFDDTERR